jgi:hypothetical protein
MLFAFNRLPFFEYYLFITFIVFMQIALLQNYIRKSITYFLGFGIKI